MKCEQLIEKLYLFIDGELSPEEECEIEAHLSECVQCLRIYCLELQFKRMVIQRLRCEEVPNSLIEKIRIALDAF